MLTLLLAAAKRLALLGVVVLMFLAGCDRMQQDSILDHTRWDPGAKMEYVILTYPDGHAEKLYLDPQQPERH